MKVKLDALPPYIKKLNPHLFVGGVEKPLTKPNLARTLDGVCQARKSGSKSVIVGLVRYASRKLDDDNLIGGLKPLRDLIAARIGIDDGDPRIKFEYGQVITTGHQGTMITITIGESMIL